VRSQSPCVLICVTWLLSLRWLVVSLECTMARPSIRLKSNPKWLAIISPNFQFHTNLSSTVDPVLVPLTRLGSFLSSENSHALVISCDLLDFVCYLSVLFSVPYCMVYPDLIPYINIVVCFIFTTCSFKAWIYRYSLLNLICGCVHGWILCPVLGLTLTNWYAIK